MRFVCTPVQNYGQSGCLNRDMWMQKGNRLPLEYMAGDAEKAGRFITLVETSVQDYRKRQRLLKQKLTDEGLEEFKERNLSDTQYITRAVYHLLNDHLKLAEDTPFAKKRFGPSTAL